MPKSIRNVCYIATLTSVLSLAACTNVPQKNYAIFLSDITYPIKERTINLFTSNHDYAEKIDGPYTLPAIPRSKIPAKYLRQEVPNLTGQPAGTLVVDTTNHFLYLTEANGKAMRYGIGVGKDGFRWSGSGVIQAKRKWPHWTPTPQMIERDPTLRNDMGSREPGLNNPLGARALYIYDANGRDTLYRIHGSPEWWSIGSNVSSGCIRLMNQDIIDLYDRVPLKTKLIVL